MVIDRQFIFVILLLLSVVVSCYASDQPADNSSLDAQASDTESSEFEAEKSAETHRQSIADAIWGYAPHNGVYLGMFTWHIEASSRKADEWNNQMIGVSYDSFFLGTFVNSFYERVVTAGINRNFYQNQLTENNFIAAGYRIGGILGYSDKIGEIRDYTPIIPFAQIYGHYQYKRVGVEIQYTGIVISAMFYFTF